jgi:hypothetical protein
MRPPTLDLPAPALVPPYLAYTFPKTMINGNPLAYLHVKLGNWDSANMDYIEHATLVGHSRN